METTVKFRPCGDCAACCEGHLIGTAHGNKYGNHKPCVFLVSGLCSIYQQRPTSCHNYQCAWSQHLLPQKMRPDQCGVLVSVETNAETGQQYLKAIEIRESVDYQVHRELKEAATRLGTELVLVPYRK